MFLKGPRRILLIHGLPRSGKTTLLERLYGRLSLHLEGYHITGFITKELRESGERTGFDLIFLRDNQLRYPLARAGRNSASEGGVFRVGKYRVFPENLEKMLEILEEDLRRAELPSILIVDEIGKMEVLSAKFLSFLERVRKDEKLVFVGTIGKGEHRVLKEWATQPEAVHVEVTPENRDFLIERLEVEFIRPGKLIVFEGIDGVGKTTLFRLLKRDVFFFDCVFSCEPTENEYGKEIRHILKRTDVSQRELLQLFLRDRWEHVRQLIIPSLKAGKHVILDRYYLSTVAYQGVELNNLQELLKLNETIAPIPDLVLYLYISPDQAIKRISGRSEERSLFEREALLHKIAKNYEMILPLFRHERIQTKRPLDELYGEVHQILRAELFSFRPLLKSEMFNIP